ncbi:thiopurine S-methyltransferase [Aestuariibacter sp. A3R04]|uniref:thiopurine S-methyltransferase n=1 Tax=Aestuariibacter sp. A3R04 TaxID=2841571 RepID=UPI001C09F414|nr:thiopurine S-methyltransferase [Aestuariibacter sp. A3R04]
MDREFWLQKWQNNETHFHEPNANPLLTGNFHHLNIKEDQTVFVPLCGKTLDISWLIAQGLNVVGAELSQLAVENLFEHLGAEPTISHMGNVLRYETHGVTIFCGDIFDLSAPVMGKVDAVYDRAALVALPLEMRRRYSEHLRMISGCAPQLLVTFEYDQEKLNGPPFSVPDNEVEQHYLSSYSLTLLHRHAIDLKGKVPATEDVWLLRPRP